MVEAASAAAVSAGAEVDLAVLAAALPAAAEPQEVGNVV